ncbi:putative DNA repair protein RecN [Ostertagia ostertagi]
MLEKLVIRNYAIIDDLVLSPDHHLNTVTGETGAGKSIILGALSLILGDRADTSVLINKEEKCIVEAHFDVSKHKNFRQVLREHELDEETHCIIRREISASGKSRAFINDTPVNLATLNKFTALLVDLHQQFDHLALQDDLFQLNVLDAVARSGQTLADYRGLYQQYRSIHSQLAELSAQQMQWQKEADYKQFLLDELLTAAFKENEVEDADQQLKSLTHSERIISVLQGTRLFLENGEQPVVNELKKLAQQLQGLSELLPASVPVQQRMSSVHEELKDIVAELEDLEERITLDPALMQELQERVDLGYKLFKKHGVTDTQGLLDLQAQLETDLQASLNLNDRITQLEKEQATLLAAVHKKGTELSELRQKAAPGLAQDVTRLLALVGMPNARFALCISIYAEEAEVGIMTWPHPVIGIAAKIANAIGGESYKAHIAVGFADNCPILVAPEIGLDGRIHFGNVLISFLKRLDPGGNHRVAGCFCERICEVVKDLVRHIFHLTDKGYGKAGAWQLFIHVFGPEAIREIVVGSTAQLLCAAVTAVMVGEQEAFG